MKIWDPKLASFYKEMYARGQALTPINVKSKWGEADYPQEFDCEVCPLGRDFDCTQCPQGREFDMVVILKDQGSLVMNHLPSCKYPEVTGSFRNLMEIMSESSQRRVSEAIFSSFYTGHPYYQSILVRIEGKELLLRIFFVSIILCMFTYSLVFFAPW